MIWIGEENDVAEDGKTRLGKTHWLTSRKRKKEETRRGRAIN